jgi:hypothetical protein
MKEVRALAPTGVLGGGFRVESLKTAMAWKPDFIGCDAGSTDGGPYYLGSGAVGFSRQSMKRDIGLMVAAAREADIPLLIGSAGTGGADAQLEMVVELAREVAREADLHFRLGMVRSEPSTEYLRAKYDAGLVRPLATAPSIDASTFERSAHVVAVSGIEPYQAALEAGANVVICGRSSDTSIFATIPTLRGLPAGPVWHAAKILECGAAAVERRRYSDPLFAWIHEADFVVEPPNPEYRCTPVSVASHNLYENGSPFELVEPGGTIFTDECVYEATSDRAVRVSGTRFVSSDQYTVKLEGSELVGFRSIVMGAIRDPIIVRQLDAWQAGMLEAVTDRLGQVYGSETAAGADIRVRRFGVDGALGAREPDATAHHEVGLVIEITASTQEMAHDMARSASHIAVHYPVSEWSGLITTLAMPYSPGVIDVGPVYRFTLNHVLELADPMEPFRVEMLEV